MQRNVLPRLLAVILFFAAALNLSAQGTAIFYQGRLSDSGSLANTNYDFRFAVYDAITNGNKISPYVTNFTVPVSNGLFSVKLDFGANVFNGSPNGSNDWMDIGVRAIGVTPFTVLAPRQPILPVPYALFATSASNVLGTLQATQLVGTLASAQLTGTFTNSVNFTNGGNSFSGTFSGNGVNLTNLNASNLKSGAVADARLSANVALLDHTQTFSGLNTFSSPAVFNGGAAFSGSITSTAPILSSAANSFTGVNLFPNLGNSFSGSFFGNGLVGWIVTNSTAFTAQFDHGYLVTNAALVTITLPPNASINPGDIVRIAGGGWGGWLAKCNAGQTIVGNFLSYSNGTLGQISSSDCYSVTASADGHRLYDATFSASGSGVFYTTDLGQTWYAVGVLSGSYFSLATSANGKIVYAEPTGSGGNIVKSSDGGLTWPSNVGTANAQSISCTSDGATLITGGIACSGNGSYRAKVVGGTVQLSINGGAFANVATAPPGSVTCVACSSDCTKLVAAVNGGKLFVSSDQGKSWTTLTAANQSWSSVWMSPDGSKFAGTVNTSGSGSGGVFYCDVSPFPNTSTASGGTLCGSRGSSVELQYLGGGMFMPVSSTGLLWAN